MIDFRDTNITNLIFHKFSLEEKNSFISDTEYDFPNEENDEILKKILLHPFKSIISTFEFKHEIDLKLNPLFNLSKKLFETSQFLKLSKDIYKHLNTVSKHPNIKDGELFIVKFDDIMQNGEYYEGLGIYKIENKESFVETKSSFDGKSKLKFKKGIGTRKLDKACLIIFSDEPYTILVIDNGSKDTEYWKNDFISLGYKNDDINNTSHFLTMAKSFIIDQIPEEYEVNKADQIDLLNKSVNYFKTNEEFNLDQFQNDVFNDNEISNSFNTYTETQKEENDLIYSSNFKISSDAVKKQSKIFKSVLKLDKNFHVYIHGDRKLIEQCTEPDGRKFYKLYYENES